VAAETENLYISGTKTYTIEMPKANRPRRARRNCSWTTATTINNRKWQYRRFGSQSLTLPFPVVCRCRNHLATLLSSSSWLKISICRCNFDAICHDIRCPFFFSTQCGLEEETFKRRYGSLSFTSDAFFVAFGEVHHRLGGSLWSLEQTLPVRVFSDTR